MRGATVGGVALAIASATLVASAGLAAAEPAGATAAERDDVGSPKADKRPNVIVIVTDDQTLDQYAPDVMRHTHRLLERRGTRFDNAFVTTPLCCPSRATFLTGQYAHNHGVLSNTYAALDRRGNTLPVWLGKAGYRTIHVGRYLNAYQGSTEPHEVAPGWDVWRTMTGPPAYFDYTLEVDGRGVRYGHRNRDYITRVINERSAQLIERSAQRPEPFYMQIDHVAPHQAGGKRRLRCKSSPIPDPRDRNRFHGRMPPPKPSFNEPDVSDKPAYMQPLPSLGERDWRRIQRRWRCSLASLRAVDRGVRDVFRALEESGQLSRTVVVFTSDNGYYFGEHRIPDKKHSPYEEGIRVPLVIRLPKALRGGAPYVPSVSETVANIDIAPTVLRLARAAPCRRPGRCRTLDGRPLLGLLRGERAGWPAQRSLVIELGRLGAPKDVGGRACAYQGIRTPAKDGPGTLYVEHTTAVGPSGGCEPVDQRELYDLAADPFQLESRSSAGGSPDRSALQAHEALLDQLRDCAGLPGRDPLPPSGHHCE